MTSGRGPVIAGVGYTEYSKKSGRSVLSLAAEACSKALADAGIDRKEVDGILTFSVGDSVPTEAVATALAVEKVNYANDWYAGGFAPAALVHLAGILVNAGVCRNVLVYRAMNGRSSIRLGGTGMSFQAKGVDQFTFPYGWLSYPQNMAMWCRRHIVKYGTTAEQLGAIAISQRDNAVKNERAMLRTPLTMENYLNSRMIAEPFRLYDICLETDGGAAVVVTSPERASDCKSKPVYIKAGAYVGGPGMGSTWADPFLWDDLSRNFTADLGPKLYKLAGMGPEDIDVAEIYDCFTYTVLMGIEGLGFCKPGEGGAFVESGAIRFNGSIPVNTHGGLLSEGYIHGMNTVVEAVMQLRGEVGERQVQGAETAIVTSGAMQMGSGLILTA